MNKHNLQVGQKLYVRHDRNRQRNDNTDLDEYEVEKIGRVWAKLKHPYYRVNLETLGLDGGRGTVYLSPKHYIDAQELHKAWSNFVRTITDMHYRRPDHVTLESIKEARLKLGI